MFAYDGDNLVEETNSAGSVVARYSQTQNIDEPLAESRSGATSYYEQDGVGSVTSLTSAAGSLAQTYTFDSFGKLTNSTGSLTNPFRYTGREFDSETSLYLYRARYYDPSTGRFISEDPIGFIGGFDFYAYVDNDPNDSADPSGLCGPCNVPLHPANANVLQNMWQSQDNGYRWWYKTVSQGHGPWDYKYYNGQSHPEYDNFGNFNYGATGCALGIPLNILLRGAGWGKSRLLPKDPYGNPFWRYPYGNQPDKQQQIINGYNYCKNCMPADNGFGGGGGAQRAGPTAPVGGGGVGPF